VRSARVGEGALTPCTYSKMLDLAGQAASAMRPTGRAARVLVLLYWLLARITIQVIASKVSKAVIVTTHQTQVLLSIDLKLMVFLLQEVVPFVGIGIL